MKCRKVLATVLSLALLAGVLPVLPEAAQAGEIVSIKTPKAGDTKVTVTYQQAEAGDNYELWLNGTKVNYGTLDADNATTGSETKTLDFYVGAKDNPTALKVGDKLNFYLEDNGVMLPSEEMTVSESKPPSLPTAMTLSATKVTAGDNASVEVSFDENYVPHEDDKLQIMRYDSKGTQLGAFDAALPDVYDGPVTITLADSQSTAYYTLTFVSGTGQSTSLSSLRVDVVAGEDPGDGDGDGDITDDEQEQLDNAVDLIFSYPSSSVSLGESVTPTIQLKDKSGDVKDYSGPVIFSYSGEAVAPGTFDSRGRFTVSSSQTYVGSRIQVSAMVGKFSKTVELTVKAGDKSLILTPASGGIGGSRSVGFQLADGAGNRLRLLWQPTMAEVYIQPKDNTAAKMVGTVTDLSTITTTGDGKMLISSDTATDANIYIIFRDGEGHFYETAIASYTFTEAGADAINVVLNIGSNYYTVNGVSKYSDTQPVVSNGRTFVPFRLLGETLGAEVEYNGTDQTITAVYNGTTTIVMTVGSTSYTINGVQKTMDVAPYINSDNRTMVPLRMVAESFGCEVEAISGPDGTTSSVTIDRE